MSLTDEDRRRRRDNKLFNKRLDLTAALLNASAIGVLATTVILPLVSAEFQFGLRTLGWIVGASSLHGIAQALLSLFKSED